MRKDRLFGLTVLLCSFATGCFSYGPYGHPGAYPPPATAMVPPTYGTLPAPGAAWVPASPTDSRTLAAPEPARKSAPTSFGDDEDHDAANPVPVPSDLKKAPVPEVEPGLSEDASLEQRGVRTSQQSRTQPVLGDDSTIESESAHPHITLAADESESDTSNVRSADFNTQVRANPRLPASPAADRFGYDAEGYSWLKGIIEFDPKQQVWHLTYNQTPDETDPYGGEVTLKNTAHFKYLRSGEVVRVEGEFDSQQVDRLGKPLYVAARLIRDVKR